MKTIGITGGIGSGKSTVTGYLKEKGYPVVDADLIARKIVEQGSSVLAEMVKHFGQQILQLDGTLDRKKMAEIAFSDPTQKRILDKITHGAILDHIAKQIEILRVSQNPSLIFVDAALLIETGLYQMMDEVWLITAHEAIRIQRVAKRDNMDVEQVKQRIRMQMTDEQKASHSLRIIDNSGTKEELFETIEKILRDYETV